MRAMLAKSLLLLCLFQVDGVTANAEVGQVPRFEIGYSANLLLDVDPTDARAATKTWIDYFIEKVGEEAESETIVLESVSETVALLREEMLDIAVLTPEEFLHIASEVELEPILATTREGQVTYACGLLVREDRSFTELEELAGGRIIVERSDKGNVPHTWLEALLADNGLPVGDEFFEEIQQVGQVSRAVLPVFFGHADACLINLESLAIMAELNPQLDRELTVLATSPRFCRTLICARPSFMEGYGDIVRESLVSLHEEPQGRQILSLFHVERLVPFEPVHLRAVVQLMGSGERPRSGRDELGTTKVATTMQETGEP